MRRVLRREGSREDSAVASEMEKERISSLMKKPFRCLVGSGRDFSDYDYWHQVVPPEEQYVPPGESGSTYGFEATLQESKKKKTRSSVFRKQDRTKKGGTSSLGRNRLLVVEPPPLEYVYAADMVPHSFPRNRSLEDLPRGAELDDMVIKKSQSFADAIHPYENPAPMDRETIHHLSKALQEVDRTLKSAGKDESKVSRAKVTKALLTVVDRLQDEEQGRGLMPTAPPSNTSSIRADRERTSSKGEAEPWIGQRRNLEQNRELTLPLNNVATSSSNTMDEVSSEPEYTSSSSEEDEAKEKSRSVHSRNPIVDMLFDLDMKDPAVRDALADLLWVPRAKKTTDASTTKCALVSQSEHQSSPSNLLDENTVSYPREDEYHDKPDSSIISEETTSTTTTLPSSSPPRRVALSESNSWIPSRSTKTLMEHARALLPSEQHSPPNSSGDEHPYHEMRSDVSFQDDDEYCDKTPSEETTEATGTLSSFASASPPRPPRENSWWQQRKDDRTVLKPSSKDTPQYSTTDWDPWQEYPPWNEN